MDNPCGHCDQRKACLFQRIACFPLAQFLGKDDGIHPKYQSTTRDPSRAIYNVIYGDRRMTDPARQMDYYENFVRYL